MRCFILISIVIVNVQDISGANNDKLKDTCEKDSCSSKSKWQDFDWETYIKEDITKVDLEDPTKRFTINLMNSINVGVNRTIPDYRHERCLEVDWQERAKGANFPDVSVVITFRNEPRSTLLRTIVSLYFGTTLSWQLF